VSMPAQDAGGEATAVTRAAMVHSTVKTAASAADQKPSRSNGTDRRVVFSAELRLSAACVLSADEAAVLIRLRYAAESSGLLDQSPRVVPRGGRTWPRAPWPLQTRPPRHRSL
jgi:hypothetical protein